MGFTCKSCCSKLRESTFLGICFLIKACSPTIATERYFKEKAFIKILKKSKKQYDTWLNLVWSWKKSQFHLFPTIENSALFRNVAFTVGLTFKPWYLIKGHNAYLKKPTTESSRFVKYVWPLSGHQTLTI